MDGLPGRSNLRELQESRVSRISGGGGQIFDHPLDPTFNEHSPAYFSLFSSAKTKTSVTKNVCQQLCLEDV